jgi:hypothetical protein
MDERIAVGVIVGLVAATGHWVWYSDFFTKTQKIIIFISFLFPPGAIGIILLISLYNKVIASNILAPDTAAPVPPKDIGVLEESLTKVKELHSKGIFNDSELNEKTSELQKQIQSIKKEKVHQSFESKVKETEEYKALLVLRTSQVIDKGEFDEKVKKLIDEHSTKASKRQPTFSTKVEPTSASMKSFIYLSFIVMGLLILLVVLGTIFA